MRLQSSMESHNEWGTRFVLTNETSKFFYHYGAASIDLNSYLRHIKYEETY